MKAVGQILERVTPLVVGQDPFKVERVWRDLFALTYTSVRGIPTLAHQRRQLVTAISAIDIAMWDLDGQGHEPSGARPPRRRAPLESAGLRDRVLLSRRRAARRLCGREAALYLEHGYRTIKVKVAGLPPEADAERVGVIRKAVGDDVAIMLDANQGWDLPSAVRATRLCEPTTSSGSRIRCPGTTSATRCGGSTAEVNVPISAGETEFTPFGLRTMVAEGLVDYLIIDSTWAGGLTVWRKAAVMAELYQVPLAAHHDPQIHVHAVRGEPDRLHPRIVRRSDARPALVRAVPRAAEDRRRLHGRPRDAGARPRAASGHARKIRGRGSADRHGTTSFARSERPYALRCSP